MTRLRPLVLCLLLLGQLLPASASAVITFTQLGEGMFVVSHRVKVIGSRGKAMKMVYEKAASLCVAAGYEYYAILDQESQATQEHEAANASARVRFFFEGGDDRIDCRGSANPEYIQDAGRKLTKQGYVWPDPPASPPAGTEAEATAAGTSSCGGSCSLEQVAAMARAGLSDEQIRAACSGDE